ncbi:stereocilin-like [Mantella aurantiaca]
MTPTDFMDCLEVIGQDPDIPTSELALLLGRVLKIAGPPSDLPNLVLSRLGRLATQFSEHQLQEISLKDWQVMEVFGKQKEWTVNQLKILASGFMNSNSLNVQALDSSHLATLGYVVCGLPQEIMGQIKASEFCSAVMYLGQLALQCTEQQLHALTRLCTNSDIFGPVSGWTEEDFWEIGSVAAGLDDMELSALILEQIQGLTPLAVSLIQPTKFAVAFSAQQLQMFSWSQAKAVTDQQKKLLDKEQMKALTLALTEDSGNQTYKGKSHADHCSLCFLLHLCVLVPALHVYNLLRPITVLTLSHPVEPNIIAPHDATSGGGPIPPGSTRGQDFRDEIMEWKVLHLTSDQMSTQADHLLGPPLDAGAQETCYQSLLSFREARLQDGKSEKKEELRFIDLPL